MAVVTDEECDCRLRTISGKRSILARGVESEGSRELECLSQ